ncbi:MAG: adenylate/guanylate cyclase domain-containing protein [Omnitrophica WOR_2 bacterium]
MDSSKSSPVESFIEPLTRREREILSLLGEGLTSREIAERLTLAISSVRWYIQQIYAKLEVNSKQQALARGHELGYLGSPSSSSATMPLPSGTITFLFTDIVGSTALWEKQPQAMRIAEKRHHEILHQVITNNQGQVFKIIGDGFQAAFSLPIQALQSALSVQFLLLAEPWGETGPLKVRMGLHTGPGEPEEGVFHSPDYSTGETFNRIARITSAAHGGQILLSLATAELLRGSLPPGVTLKDLGEHHFKGLLKPEHIYQAVSSDLPSEFPPLVSLTYPLHNLPRQLTSFISREKETSQVKNVLREHSLVTLTGPGGVGKTRLSLKVAEEVLVDYPDGVWFVELAPLTDPARVPQQVTAALGLREEPNRPIQDYLASYLQSRQTLLVLDNCEHVLDACTRLAELLLHDCLRLKIIASSREPLGVAGEAVFRVPSLSFPDLGESFDMEKPEAYAAIRLFIDRARLVMPDYQVTAQNTPYLATICQRLDGIPLAIELAAARMNLLTAEELANRLDHTFHLLGGGNRTALPRHQTLRATIDWSYNLLNEKERLLFQRLSVFAAGCTLEAAEVVCSMEGIDTGEVLNLLGSLVEKSMVVAERNQGNQTRYSLLETMRQYALEKLQGAGEIARMRTRHRDYFLEFTETYKSQLWLKERSGWFRKFEAEHENLRLALEWSINVHPDVEAGIRLILAADNLWVYSHYQEAADWFERGLVLCQRHPEISPSLYATFLGVGSYRIAFNNPQNGLAWGKQAVEISRRLGPGGTISLIGSLLSLVWITMWDLDDVKQALETFTEAEFLFQELNPDQYTHELYLATKGGLVFHKAEISNKQGCYEDAITYARESIRIQEQLGQPNIIWELLFMGEAHVSLEEYDQARDCYLKALYLADEIVDNRKSLILRNLGMVDFHQGNLEQALENCQKGLRLAVEISDNNVVATCLGLSACILAKQGKLFQAAGLSGAAKSLYERQGRKPLEDSGLDAILPGWRDRPENRAILKAYEEGSAMTVDQAVSLAQRGLGEYI